MNRRSTQIDAIHAALAPPVRRALDAIRRAVHAAAPGAEECLSYGMPAVRYEGKPLVAWRAAAKHCAFHPLSGQTVAACRDVLGGYDTSPGTIRFTPDRVLPPSVVKRLVDARINENRALGAKPQPSGTAARTTATKTRKKVVKKVAKKVPKRRVTEAGTKRVKKAAEASPAKRSAGTRPATGHVGRKGKRRDG